MVCDDKTQKLCLENLIQVCQFSAPNNFLLRIVHDSLCYNSSVMTTITILPETTNSYRAFTGDKESTGRTAGEALDALASQLEEDESGTLVIVQNRKADRFFTTSQRTRLTELMQRRKAGNLSLEEENELESLVEAELNGARQRAETLLSGLKP